MRKAGRLYLSIAYYHNISFAIAAGGCVLTHFSGGFKSVRKARSPNSRGRLSHKFLTTRPAAKPEAPKTRDFDWRSLFLFL